MSPEPVKRNSASKTINKRCLSLRRSLGSCRKDEASRRRSEEPSFGMGRGGEGGDKTPMFLITEIKAWNFIGPLLYLRRLYRLMGTNGFRKRDCRRIRDGPTDKSPRLAANDETSFMDSSAETSFKRGSQAVVSPRLPGLPAGACGVRRKSLASFPSPPRPPLFFFFFCERHKFRL